MDDDWNPDLPNDDEPEDDAIGSGDDDTVDVIDDDGAPAPLFLVDPAATEDNSEEAAEDIAPDSSVAVVTEAATVPMGAAKGSAAANGFGHWVHRRVDTLGPQAKVYRNIAHVGDPEGPKVFDHGLSRFSKSAMCDLSTPLAAWRHFFDDALLTRIHRCTNARMLATSPTSALLQMSEMYTYFALTIAMGLKRQPTVASYWDTQHFGMFQAFYSYCCAGVRQRYRCTQLFARVLSCCTALRSDLFRRAMTRDRFTTIHSCLCFVDSADTPSVPPSDPSYDRLWKIKPVIDHVLAVSKKLYCMSKEVSLDEQMVSCRGRARGLQRAHPLTQCQCYDFLPIMFVYVYIRSCLLSPSSPI